MKEAIETNVDKLIEYISACNETSSSQAAAALGVSIDQIEEWAKPLEESDLIAIKYSPIHGMVMSPKNISSEELNQKTNEFKARKEKLAKEERKLERIFSSYSKKLPKLKLEMKRIEKKYAARVKEAQAEQSPEEMDAILSDLNAVHEALKLYEKELDELQKEKNNLSKSIDEFQKDVLVLEKKAKLASKSKSFKEFYDFLTKAEKDAIEARKEEKKFINDVLLLREKTDALLPQVQGAHQTAHKLKLSNIFKIFRFRRKK